MAVLNYATAISAREYYASHMPLRPVPADFVHEPPTGDATSPAFPGALTGPEQAQITQWLLDHIDANVTLAGAVTWLAAYIAYVTNPVHLNWVIDDRLQREFQWVWRCADNMDAASTVTAPSSMSTGIGAGALAVPIPVSPN